MNQQHIFQLLIATLALTTVTATSAPVFEGRIHAISMQGGQAMPLLYTVGTNFLRVELTVTNWPNPVDILDRNSGALTLLFPHNRSFVRLKPAAEHWPTPPGFPPKPGGIPQSKPPGVPGMPNSLPPDISPINLPSMVSPPAGLPPGVGPQTPAPNAPGVPAMPPISVASGMPSMPAMPMMPMEKIELKATGEKTNLLGFACENFEIKQRGEVMEIWATDQLLPFQNYVRNQPSRFGPRMIEEQWAGLLTAKKLFPLRASLHFENGPERYRSEVQSITPQKLSDEDLKLFQPPGGYFETAIPQSLNKAAVGLGV